MSVLKTIIKNSTYILFAEILGKIMVLVFTILVARKLGVSDFGKYSFAVSFVMIFSFIIDLGLTTFLCREIPRNKNLITKYVNNILIMRAVLFIFTFFIVLLLVNLLNYSIEMKKLIYMLSCWISTTIISQVFRGCFKAMERMEYEAVISLLDNILKLAFVVIALWFNYEVIGVAFAVLLASLTSLSLSALIYHKKFYRFSFDIDLSLWIPILKEAIPFVLTATMFIYLTRVDILMVSFFKGDHAVGLYSAASRLCNMLIFIPASIVAAFFPKMSQYAFECQNKFNKLVSSSIKIIFVITSSLNLIIFIFSLPIIYMIYGANYIESYQILQILLGANLFVSLSLIFTSIIDAKNQQKINVLVMSLALLFNVILNIILIPKYSHYGAAFATFISSALLFLLLFIFVLTQKSISIEFLRFPLKNYP